MLKNDAVRLHHILDAAREAIAFSRNRSCEDLKIGERNWGLPLIFDKFIHTGTKGGR